VQEKVENEFESYQGHEMELQSPLKLHKFKNKFSQSQSQLMDPIMRVS